MKNTNNLHTLAKDLYKVKPERFYIELSFYAFVGWIAYFHKLITSNVVTETVSFIISTLFLYKGLSFIHEVSHFEKQVKGLRLLYNTLFGFPLKVPAYSIKTHAFHHNKKTFGTNGDPEYTNWTERRALFLLRPLVLSFFYPLFLTLRFGVMPIILRFTKEETNRWIHRNLSTFVMNLKYERPYSESDFRDMQNEDLSCSLFFVAFAAVSLKFNLFIEAFSIGYLQITVISIMNTYRALVAHRYEAHKIDLRDSTSQLLDSVTIEGNILTSIWAPIGLRYHSTHHFFPQIPYYNLSKAHKIIKDNTPEDHPYHKTIEPNFLTAFRKLVKACK